MLAANPYHLFFNWLTYSLATGAVSSQSLDTSPLAVFDVVGLVDVIGALDVLCESGSDGDVPEARRAQAPERGRRAGNG